MKPFTQHRHLRQRARLPLHAASRLRRHDLGTFAGAINHDFTAWVDTFGIAKQTQIVDPQLKVSIDTEHLLGAVSAPLHNGLDNGKADYSSLADYVGWAGDLLQVLRAYKQYGSLYSNGADWANTYIFSTGPTFRRTTSACRT